ncbi:TonB-dependent receptor [Magnetospirillum aberrantis]|uniref:TonB-dependent receptor n=1 Tax=Magnetospirillum aberrantis SpK TaxID=908842 RepID=A0A7C9QSN9_9PROT|nr:TonB-dependent receptor [Magnetospirillum aberrantis]NFV79600.1 TonB-dependent receptor [Magnetospirillum aberrantis SpK]
MRYILGSTALVTAALTASAAMAQTATDLKLPDQQVIPVLRQHDKPEPFPIMPLVDMSVAPGEMPYRQDKMKPSAGVLGTLMNSASPVKIGLGYSGAGDTKEAFAQAAMRTAKATVMASTAAETASTYKDGNGDKVRYGYDRTTEQVGLVFRPLSGTTLKAGLVHDLIDDHVLPLAATGVTQNGVANMVDGYGADPIRTERTIATTSVEKTAPMDGLDAVKLELRYVGLKRRANNFKLRPYTSTTVNEANPNRDVLSASLSGDTHLADNLLGRLTVSGSRIWHDASRAGGGGVTIDTISGYQYPGVEMWEGAVNADLAWRPAEGATVNLGLRYDYAGAKATEMDNPMRIGNYSGSPSALYEYYYGTGIDKARDDHMFSAKVDGEQKLLANRLSLTGSVGRIMRAADTQERYFTLPSPTTASATRQVGNPDLAPEQHYRAELGAALNGEDWVDYGRKRPGGEDWLGSSSWNISAKGYVDHVKDFISRDRAHGQSGTIRSDNAFIWRNVDADLAGAEIELSVNLTRNWSTKLGGYWRWGQNATDGRALYGIDPLEANWLVEYQDTLADLGTWNAGFKVRAVAAQNRLDDDPSYGSGFDAENAGGFGLLDLFAGFQVMDTFGMRVGIDNVFDKAYSEHNPYTSTDEANPSTVYAPGRTAYVRGLVTF